MPHLFCPLQLYSPVFLVRSHVNVPLYKKKKLRKTIQAKTSCYSAWVYFQYLLSFFFSSSLRFMLFPPPNLELIMSVCMAFVTLVESCSDSRRPCSREGEEEAPAAGCRELPLSPLPVWWGFRSYALPAASLYEFECNFSPCGGV